MNRVVKKRKMSFWALVMVVILLCSYVPVPVTADTYTSYSQVASAGKVNEGDLLDCIDYDVDIYYYQSDESTVMHQVNIKDYKHTVLNYSDMPEAKREKSVGAFKYWKVSQISESSGKISGLRLTPVFYTESAITYNNMTGAVNHTNNPAAYYEGKEDIILQPATKSGYIFEGWYSDAALTNSVTSIPKTKTGPVVLYAKFTNEFDINYVLNDGTNAAGNPTTYTYGTGVAGFAPASKTGYTFKGWYSEASFTNQVTSIGADQSGAVTLYAQFEANSYHINYELNGGTNAAGNPATYTYGTGVAGLADASREGYTFDGWYENADFTGEKVTGIPATLLGDVTLYAKFSGNSYNIYYELNGGTNAEDNPNTYICGTGVAGLADASREGYTFDGWYENADFTGEKVTGIPASLLGDITLYAKFSENSYHINYELNGGTNAAGNPATYTYGTGVADLADASREGYTFDGWYENADFTGEKVTGIPTTLLGDVTLYAKFSGNSYHINYELNGGTNAEDNPNTYICGTGVAGLADASREGYTFDGWYENADFTGEKVTGIPATLLGDVTLYAKFTENLMPTPTAPAPTPTAPAPTPTAPAPTVPASTEPTSTELTPTAPASTESVSTEPEQTASVASTPVPVALVSSTPASVNAQSVIVNQAPKTDDNSSIILCFIFIMISGFTVSVLRKNTFSKKMEE